MSTMPAQQRSELEQEIGRLERELLALKAKLTDLGAVAANRRSKGVPPMSRIRTQPAHARVMQLKRRCDCSSE